MNKPSSFPLSFSWRRTPPPPAEPDAADMGTTFGLEMSLDQPDPAPGAQVSPGAVDWLRRLAHWPAA